MAKLQRFIPQTPDPYLKQADQLGAVKFGHLNALVDSINSTVYGDYLQLQGDGPMSTTLRALEDPEGNLAKLYLAIDKTAILGPLKVGDVSANQPSAILQIDSTSQGVLFPRMTVAERDAIASPATGLIIYNSDDSILNTWDGTEWTEIGGGGLGLLDGAVLSATLTPVVDKDNVQSPLQLSTSEVTAIGSGLGSTQFGANADASGSESMSIGQGSSSPSYRSISVGISSNTGGAYSIAIGRNANTGGNYAISIGNDANTGSNSAISIGKDSDATGGDSVAIANNALASGASAISLGAASDATASRSTAIGVSSLASGTDAIAIGNTAQATSTNSIVIGNAATLTATTPNNDSIVIGTESIGHRVSIAMGYRACNTGCNSVAIGFCAESAIQGVAIGKDSISSVQGAVAIGTGSVSSACGVSIGKDVCSSRDAYAIGGMGTNCANSRFSMLAGGQSNSVGLGNQSFGQHGGVFAGCANGVGTNSFACFSSITGGACNIINNQVSHIGGGNTNTITGCESFIGSGNQNNASNSRSVIGGGVLNVASGFASTVVGGQSNCAINSYSVAGGNCTRAAGCFSVAMGCSAQSNGTNSIAFGNQVQANGSNSYVIGSEAQATTNYAYALTRLGRATGYASVSLGYGGDTNSKRYSNVFGGGGKSGNDNENIFANSVNQTNEGVTHRTGYYQKRFQIVGANSQNRGAVTPTGQTIPSATTWGLTESFNFRSSPQPHYTPLYNNVYFHYESNIMLAVNLISGTATGVSVGDYKLCKLSATGKRYGGVNTVLTSTLTVMDESSSMSTATFDLQPAGSGFYIRFTAPTFAGEGELDLTIMADNTVSEMKQNL